MDSFGYLIPIYIFFKGESGEGGANLSLVTSTGVNERKVPWRGKWKEADMEKFRLDVMKSFFTERVIRDWNSLPREEVVTSRWSKFKEHLEKAVKYMATF